MSDEKHGKKKRGTFFYDVEHFRQVRDETQHTRGRFSRMLGRVTGVFSSIEGFLVTILSPLIIFGMVLLLFFGISLGPFALLGIAAAGIVGVTLIVERQGGGGENFNGYDFWKSMAAQVLGYSLAASFVLLLLFLGRIPLPHVGF